MQRGNLMDGSGSSSSGSDSSGSDSDSGYFDEPLPGSAAEFIATKLNLCFDIEQQDAYVLLLRTYADTVLEFVNADPSDSVRRQLLCVEATAAAAAHFARTRRADYSAHRHAGGGGGGGGDGGGGGGKQHDTAGATAGAGAPGTPAAHTTLHAAHSAASTVSAASSLSSEASDAGVGSLPTSPGRRFGRHSSSVPAGCQLLVTQSVDVAQQLCTGRCMYFISTRAGSAPSVADWQLAATQRLRPDDILCGTLHRTRSTSFLASLHAVMNSVLAPCCSVDDSSTLQREDERQQWEQQQSWPAARATPPARSTTPLLSLRGVVARFVGILAETSQRIEEVDSELSVLNTAAVPGGVHLGNRDSSAVIGCTARSDGWLANPPTKNCATSNPTSATDAAVAALARWTAYSNTAMVEEDASRICNTGAGPHTELQWWQRRAFVLQSLHEQLTSSLVADVVRTVLSALQAGAILASELGDELLQAPKSPSPTPSVMRSPSPTPSSRAARAADVPGGELGGLEREAARGRSRARMQHLLFHWEAMLARLDEARLEAAVRYFRLIPRALAGLCCCRHCRCGSHHWRCCCCWFWCLQLRDARRA